MHDAEGYVRQGVDAEGEVISAWLFDPDGTVLEGPNGPVSHLVCGGVYDWSTGLIYRGGRYFDPMLGIWLALMPLMVVQGWRKRKDKRQWVLLVCVGLFAVGSLAGCGKQEPTTTLSPVCTPTAMPGLESGTGTSGDASSGAGPSPKLCNVEKTEVAESDPFKGVPTTGWGQGMESFYKEITVTFWLGPGVDAQRDCFCSSWVKGNGYISQNSQDESPLWNRDATSWHEDFPIVDVGVEYNGNHVIFHDRPGKTDLQSGETIRMDLDFLTALYDQSYLALFPGYVYERDDIRDNPLLPIIPSPKNPEDFIEEPYPIFAYPQDDAYYDPYRRNNPDDYVVRWNFKDSYQVF